MWSVSIWRYKWCVEKLLYAAKAAFKEIYQALTQIICSSGCIILQGIESIYLLSLRNSGWHQFIYHSICTLAGQCCNTSCTSYIPKCGTLILRWKRTGLRADRVHRLAEDVSGDDIIRNTCWKDPNSQHTKLVLPNEKWTAVLKQMLGTQQSILRCEDASACLLP